MIPRLRDLYTFVVVARAGSMKHAASALGVTPGAVSQRIRDLEIRHGGRLFERNRAGVSLNRSGQRLFAQLNEAFAIIEEVSGQSLQTDRTNSLRISAAAGFATSWLVPRLGDFTQANPGISISIETSAHLIDFRREPIDLGIRHGLGHYPGLEAHWIVAPELIVIASPALLQHGAPLRTPADCLRFPLLQDQDRKDWPLWFEALGVEADGARYGPSFSDDSLLVRAAAEGQGLALVRDFHAADDFMKNKVRRALDISCPAEFAYYLVGLPEAFERPAAKRFVSWLIPAARQGFEPDRA
jgi:LysR family transcriptional regulator, glycine cleavage system transcriptional activator